MLKVLSILLFGLACESTGVILLKKGMIHIGDMNGYTVAEIFRVFKAGATSPQILLGVFFEAVFFGCLLLLMNKSDISFLWPLTAVELCVRDVRRDDFSGRKRFVDPLDRRRCSSCSARPSSATVNTRRKNPRRQRSPIPPQNNFAVG